MKGVILAVRLMPFVVFLKPFSGKNSEGNSNIIKKAEKLINFFLFLTGVYLFEKYDY